MALGVSEAAILKTTMVDVCGVCLSSADRRCIFPALGGNLAGNDIRPYLHVQRAPVDVVYGVAYTPSQSHVGDQRHWGHAHRRLRSSWHPIPFRCLPSGLWKNL